MIDNNLEKCDLFKNINSEQITTILKCIPHCIKNYHKKDIIINIDQTISSIGIILEGEIVINKYDFLGNKSIIGCIGKYNSFGEAIAIANKKSSVEIVANKECKILFLDIGKVYCVCHNNCSVHQQLRDNLILNMSNKILILNEKNEYLSIKSVRDKIIQFLTNQSIKNNSLKFDIKYNREELANYLNVERTVLSKHLSILKQEGIIDFHKNYFEIKKTSV